MQHPVISSMRLLIAALFAPIVGAILTFTCWNMSYGSTHSKETIAEILTYGFVAGALIGLPLMLFFGVPIYYLLQRRNKSFLWEYCALGAVVGVLGIMLGTALLTSELSFASAYSFVRSPRWLLVRCLFLSCSALDLDTRSLTHLSNRRTWNL